MTEATDLAILLDEIRRKADKSWLGSTLMMRQEIWKLLKRIRRDNNPGFTPEEVNLMKQIVGGFGITTLRSSTPALGALGGFVSHKLDKTAESRFAELRSMVSARG